MTDWLFVNPSSGGDDDVDWAELLEQSGIRLGGTWNSFDALDAATIAAGDRVLVAGGDGTVNGMVERAIDSGWTLGVLPGGTGNDFARSLGMALAPEKACAQIAEAVTREVDIARINDCILLNAAQIGLGPEVTEDADRRFKRFWGSFGYLRSLIERLFRGGGVHARIVRPDGEVDGHWKNITIANGPYFGGGHSVNPDSTIEDGRLDVVALRARPWLQLLWAGLLRKVGIGDSDTVEHWRVTRVNVHTKTDCSVSVDGDIRLKTPISAEIHPRVLKVSAPVRPEPSSLLS